MRGNKKILKLVVLRHGESTWNLENRFAGWSNVALTEKGKREAIEAGNLLKSEGYTFDRMYTSLLQRSIDTCYEISKILACQHVPVERHWRLNERHYGGLTGLNKVETVEKHGEAQVKLWRRSFDVPPPPMPEGDPREAKNDPMYKGIPSALLPKSESLKMTAERTLPFFFDRIWPQVYSGKNVLVVAHGNSLRGIHKFLTGMDEKSITEFNFPTAVPMLYELDEDLKLQGSKFLGNQEEIKKKMDAVANQTKAK